MTIYSLAGATLATNVIVELCQRSCGGAGGGGSVGAITRAMTTVLRLKSHKALQNILSSLSPIGIVISVRRGRVPTTFVPTPIFVITFGPESMGDGKGLELNVLSKFYHRAA